MSRLVGRASEGALLALLLGCLLLQILLPELAEAFGGAYAETESLTLPYALAGIAALFCLECVLVITFFLVRELRAKHLLPLPTPDFLLGIGVLFCGVFGIPALVLLHLLAVVQVGGPGIVLLLAANIIVGVASVCFALALRSSARSYLALQTEMQGLV
ncbi:hypothetical protein [Dermabacter sp. HSID17554]|uniref:hypothetical protein n=1 Tax=Dermabacter sp. HSID17554 TaxID=2419511 RepID=UPI000F862D9A|nr:hypothetical protein [Dermabacter sp. HSID17554]RUP87460.1 hypothetical protein D8M36_02475 [Dermabacter sp. HSID17554]